MKTNTNRISFNKLCFYIVKIAVVFILGFLLSCGTDDPSSPDSPDTLNPLLNAPGSLAVGKVTSSTIYLSWTASDGATSYKIDTGSDYQIVNQGATNTSRDIAGLKPNTPYALKVTACNDDGCSLGATTNVTTAPNAPQNFTNEGIATTRVVLKWDMVDGATSYVVYQNKDGSPTPIATNTGNTYAVTGLTPEADYAFELEACNYFGCSSSRSSHPITTATPDTQNPSLSAPESLTVGKVTSLTIDLSWMASTGATFYKVSTVSDSQIVNQSVNNTSLDIAGLKPNTSYDLKVTACNDDGCSPEATTNVTTAPNAPQNFAGEGITSTSVVLKWDVVDGATSYIVYQNKDGSPTPIATNTAPTHMVDNLIPETLYTFELEACNYFGCSSSRSRYPITTAQNTQNQLLSAPGSLTVGKVTSSTIYLSWTASPGATSYKIDTGSDYQVINQGVNNTSRDITGLKPNTPYTLKVTACNDDGCSPEATTNVTTAPGAPQNFTSKVVTSTNVVLKWDVAPGATSYIVYQNKDGSPTPIATNTGNTYTVDDLSSNIEYTFWVESCNDSGCSSSKSRRTITTAPDVPQNFTANNIIQTSVTLNWILVNGATKYIIYQGGDPIATNTGTSYTVNNLKSITTYSFSIQACNSWGCSDVSGPISATTLSHPDFFTIRYPDLVSENPSISTPVIVSGKNCDLQALTTSRDVTYGIVDILRNEPVLLTVSPFTGEVINNGKASPGIYEVTVRVAKDSRCNTNVIIYNTVNPVDKAALKAAIQQGTNLYGNTGNFNYIRTHQIKDMSGLFAGSGSGNDIQYNQFDGDITEWSTSNVTDMSQMFQFAYRFNQDISGWDTSRVQNMHRMFFWTGEFNQDLSKWKVENVTNYTDIFDNSPMSTVTDFHPKFIKQ